MIYDYIIANQFSVDNESIQFAETANASMQDILLKFKHLIVPNGFSISMNELISINVMLFASMIPLHDENTFKQNAFFSQCKKTLYDVRYRVKNDYYSYGGPFDEVSF